MKKFEAWKISNELMHLPVYLCDMSHNECRLCLGRKFVVSHIFVYVNDVHAVFF